MLKAKHSQQKHELTQVYLFADILQEALFRKLEKYAYQFNEDLMENNRQHGAIASQAQKNDEEHNYYFRNEIIKIAKKYDYYADTKHYKSWSRMIINTGNIFEIVFSIHGFGHSDNGVMAISGFTFEKNISEDEVPGAVNTKSAQQDIFVFNYLDRKEEVNKRFEEWIDESFVIALAEWQQTIT